ncbi:MAG: hypothetical protein K6F50_03815 [Kiritimatiellae bacterium]|nr:hypothetical protein [Kiritimatiellia bacterium]
MKDESLTPGRYAGDEAWREWFEICSVGGCSAERSAALRRQIESAMYSNLLKRGISREEAGADDPVAVFDAYFKLKGTREKKKPLKSYFLYRIKVEGLRLADFVCGTLFGSGAGRIHDIIIDWIASIKGWRPRKVKGADGRRHIEWESAGPEEIASIEPSSGSDPAELLDLEPMRREIEELLGRISSKMKAEKIVVASLLYATAQDVPINDAAILEGLGTKKSRAYVMRDRAIAEFRKEARTIEGADSPLFGRVLLEACEASIPESLLKRIGGER